MKQFLVKARVYETDGLLPDFFGENQEVVVEAPDLPTARGIFHNQIKRMSSHVAVQSIEEIKL